MSDLSQKGDQKQHRLASTARLLKTLFPVLASSDAARRIGVEKYVIPAFAHEPITNRNGFGNILAGMADEKAGHLLSRCLQAYRLNVAS